MRHSKGSAMILAAAVIAGGARATAQPDVVDLAVGAQLYQCARMSDGTVRCMGLNAKGRFGNGRTDQVNVPSTTVPGLRDVEQLVTDQMGTTCTRHRDGTLRCWGSNVADLLGTKQLVISFFSSHRAERLGEQRVQAGSGKELMKSCLATRATRTAGAGRVG